MKNSSPSWERLDERRAEAGLLLARVVLGERLRLIQHAGLAIAALGILLLAI